MSRPKSNDGSIENYYRSLISAINFGSYLCERNRPQSDVRPCVSFEFVKNQIDFETMKFQLGSIFQIQQIDYGVPE